MAICSDKSIFMTIGEIRRLKLKGELKAHIHISLYESNTLQE